jgi:hypothetical protein
MPRNQSVEPKEPPARIVGSKPRRFPKDSRTNATAEHPKAAAATRGGSSVAVFDFAAVRYLRGLDAADSVSRPQPEGVQLVAQTARNSRRNPVRQIVLLLLVLLTFAGSAVAEEGGQTKNV